MSLFGDLPPPKKEKKDERVDLAHEYKPRAIPTEQPPPLLKTEHDEERSEDEEEDRGRPDKRQRTEPGAGDGGADGGGGGGGGLSSAQVTAALHKLASHISNPDKFPKASGLLRQLLEGGALGREHREPLFAAIKAAFSDFDNASEASLRRDYMKLVHCLERRAEPLLSGPQRRHLEVYRVVGFLQNEMHTDDSFVFNKVLARIKEAVVALPPATEADEDAAAELAGAGPSSDEEDADGADEAGAGGRGQRRGGKGEGGGAPGSRWGTLEGAVAEPEPAEEGQGAPGPAPKPAEAAAEDAAEAEAPADVKPEPEADPESDPFGLESLMPAPKRPPPPPPPPPKPEPGSAGAAGAGAGSSGAGAGVWTAAQALVMRRAALLECLITARGFHKTPWARVGVELLVEHYSGHRDRFTGEQQLAIDEMVRFVRQARQARPSGPSAKEINRDTTSFDRARADWSKVKVSHRGKVGAQGDAKSQNWLG
ncbi:hypothetical protein HYH03_016426 [Edaphochlamys debaryana]|uniref:Uncharacterized protein n=1 Tax=Edaphochlamys debaryana TaxID=47281 RepID=A0A835XHK1_9CHLO|nr:hypothetical protein HYH03_016426 [Edaphochlamys debaryana]|eukprot:KAG2484772.1 hypothetical protein HYH03_016426 [Edaphochlamys debaryana]